MLIETLSNAARAVCAFAFLCGVLAFPSFGQAWTEVRTRNFVLIGDGGEKEIRQTGLRLEQFRETIGLLFPQLRLDGGVRTNVVVFRDAASYAPFKPKRPDGTVDTAVVGYFQRGEDVNYITISLNAGAGSYETIFHEYVHFMLDANIGRSDLPPWLGEGLAEYFETVQVLDGRRVVLGASPAGHLALLRKNEPIPLGEFLAADNAALHRRGDESRNLFYAQAWAMTSYLLHAGKTDGMRFENLLAEAKLDSPEKTSARLLGSDHAALTAKLRDHINQPVIPTRIVQLPQQLAMTADATAVTLSEAGADAYLGDLLYHTGRPAEAEILLRKALRADPGISTANVSLGLILAGKREFGQAAKYLEKAIAADPTNHFAHFNYAYVLSREHADENGRVYEFPAEAAGRMRAALQRSISLNPNFAESYRLLGLIGLVSGSGLDEAAASLEKGLALKPGDEHLRMTLARVLLAQEKYSEAEAIAEKLARGASDARVWSESQSILHTVNQYRAAASLGANDDGESIRSFGPLPPLIVKRSSVTESAIARYEEDRLVTNLNVLIDKPNFGEKQAVGYVDKITCSDGVIRYAVRAGNERFDLVSTGFGGIKLKVLTEGESSFTLDCGVSLAETLTVLTYQPSAGSAARGRLVSMAFVPSIFRLKTAQEMTSWRNVIVEDDRVYRRRPESTTVRSEN